MHTYRSESSKRVTAPGNRPVAGGRDVYADGNGNAHGAVRRRAYRKAVAVERRAAPPDPKSGEVSAHNPANVVRKRANETVRAKHCERRRAVSQRSSQAGRVVDAGPVREGFVNTGALCESGGGKLPALPDGYFPSDSETYMNPMQLAYFRVKLATMRDALASVLESAITRLREGDGQYEVGDDADAAFEATTCAVDLHGWARQRNLLGKVLAALRRIDAGEYGYCQETGEPIGLARLEARPTATLCIDAQECHEYARKGYAR